jgi:hypothetical protein
VQRHCRATDHDLDLTPHPSLSKCVRGRVSSTSRWRPAWDSSSRPSQTSSRDSPGHGITHWIRDNSDHTGGSPVKTTRRHGPGASLHTRQVLQ